MPVEERIRAVEVLTELFGSVPVETATKLGDAAPELRARMLWSLSRAEPSAAAYRVIAQATDVPDPWVGRAAWEALASWPAALPPDAAPDWHTGLGHADRRVRAAAMAAAGGPGRSSYDTAKTAFQNPTARHRLAELWVRGPGAGQDPKWTESYCRTCVETCAREQEPSVRLEAVRLLQLALGDVVTTDGPDRIFIGYTGQATDRLEAKLRATMAVQLAALFPTGAADLDRELARLLGMLGEEAAGLPEHIATRWAGGSRPEDDIHYLIVMARLPGKRSPETTQRTANALNGIYTKLAAQGARPADQVPALLESLLDRLMQRDAALASHLCWPIQRSVYRDTSCTPIGCR